MKNKKKKHHTNLQISWLNRLKEKWPSPFEKYEFHKHDKSVKALTFLICSCTAWKGNTKSTRNIIPCFKFHTLYKAEFKALLTSTIKAIYTKKTHLSTETHNLWFCVLYILKLFNLPTVLSSKHCKRAFSAITYSNRLSVMWMDSSKQREKTKRLMGSEGWSCCANQPEVKSHLALLAPFKSHQMQFDPKYNVKVA